MTIVTAFQRITIIVHVTAFQRIMIIVTAFQRITIIVTVLQRITIIVTAFQGITIIVIAFQRITIIINAVIAVEISIVRTTDPIANKMRRRCTRGSILEICAVICKFLRIWRTIVICNFCPINIFHI